MPGHNGSFCCDSKAKCVAGKRVLPANAACLRPLYEGDATPSACIARCSELAAKQLVRHRGVLPAYCLLSATCSCVKGWDGHPQNKTTPFIASYAKPPVGQVAPPPPSSISKYILDRPLDVELDSTRRVTSLVTLEGREGSPL